MSTINTPHAPATTPVNPNYPTITPGTANPGHAPVEVPAKADPRKDEQKVAA